MGQGGQSHGHARRIIAGLGLLAWSGAAFAASTPPYPVRPLRMIVPATPGASSDVLGRIVAAQLSTAFGQQVIVNNRPGAGSVIGTDIVAKAAPDGYTIVMIYTSHTTNASLQKLPYDPLADFAPVTMITSAPLVLIVPAASNIASVKELIATGKAQTLAYGSAGVGSGGHLSGELFRTMTSIKRAASLPDVPSLAEAGLAGFEVLNWFGVAGPARTPPVIVAKLNATTRHCALGRGHQVRRRQALAAARSRTALIRREH